MTIGSPLKNTFNVGGITTVTNVPYTTPAADASGNTNGLNASNKIGFYSDYFTKAHPATKKKIEGFKWDERLWTDDSTENWYQQIPRNTNPSTSGVEDYFQYGHGFGRDINLEDIIELPSSGVDESLVFEPYSPVIFHGHYYNGAEENFLFSDDSEIIYPTRSEIVEGVLGYEDGISPPDPFSTIDLDSIPKSTEPIKATTFIWDDSSRSYSISTQWEKRGYFTGRVEESELLDTWNELKESILYSNIDQTLGEFIITYSGIDNETQSFPSIIFSNQVSRPHGFYNDVDVKFDTLDLLGFSDGTNNQSFHTLYAPIDEGVPPNIFSFTYLPSGVIDSDILASGVDGYGIVGGGLLPSGVIETGFLTADVYEWLPRGQGVTLSGYSAHIDYDLGIVSFGNEDGSVPVPEPGSYVGIAYNSTARVEYEPEDTLDTITSLRSNVNPIYRYSPNGFLFISNKDLQPTSITLAANASIISTDLYGPVYLGGTLVEIIATVLDNSGSPVEGETVTFAMDNDTLIGTFTSSSTSTSAITDNNGKAHAYYVTPRDIDDVSETVTYDNFTIDNSPSIPGVSQATILRTSALKINDSIDTDNIYLFKVETGDYTLGGLDHIASHADLQAQELEYYEDYLTDLGIYGPTGIPVADYVSGKPWDELHRELQGLLEPSIYGFNNATGKKTIVADWDASALDPHDFSTGAWNPVHPLSVSGVSSSVYDITYDTSLYDLTIPSGSNSITPSGTVYGYSVVAPARVKMVAYVVNEELNKTITSNEIQLDLQIPDHMNGVWVLDEINQAHIDEISATLFGIAASGQHVPIGFRIRSDSIVLASALGGITFLDINTEYNADIWDTITPLQQTFTVSGIS